MSTRSLSMNNCNTIFAFRVFCFNSHVLTLDIQWCAIHGAVSLISDIEGVHADQEKTTAFDPI